MDDNIKIIQISDNSEMNTASLIQSCQNFNYISHQAKYFIMPDQIKCYNVINLLVVLAVSLQNIQGTEIYINDITSMQPIQSN